MIAIAGWNFYHLPRSQMLDIKKSFRLNCVIRFSWLVWCLRMVILTKVTWVFLSQENKILTKIFLSPALTVTTRCGTSRTCWSTRTGRFSGSRQPSTRWVTRNKYYGGDEDWSWVWGDLEDISVLSVILIARPCWEILNIPGPASCLLSFSSIILEPPVRSIRATNCQTSNSLFFSPTTLFTL